MHKIISTTAKNPTMLTIEIIIFLLVLLKEEVDEEEEVEDFYVFTLEIAKSVKCFV